MWLPCNGKWKKFMLPLVLAHSDVAIAKALHNDCSQVLSPAEGLKPTQGSLRSFGLGLPLHH